LRPVHLAGHVRGAFETDELEDLLLKCGMDAGLDGIVMEDKDGLMLNNLILRALHEEIDAYDDETFQATLADELAARDLGFVKTQEEIDALHRRRIRRRSSTRKPAVMKWNSPNTASTTSPLPIRCRLRKILNER